MTDSKLPPAPELLAGHDTSSLRKIRAALTVRNDPQALMHAVANFATMLLDGQLGNPDRVARDKAAAEDKRLAEAKAKADAEKKPEPAAAMPGPTTPPVNIFGNASL